MLPLQGAQVQSLITELRSCKMYSMAKKTPPMKKIVKCISSLLLSTVTLSCNQSPEVFSSCKTKAVHSPNSSPCPFPEPLATNILLSMHLITPGTSYKHLLGYHISVCLLVTGLFHLK